jgi:NADPH:quinone reductase
MSMKAIRPKTHGGAELLTLEELPTPSPGPGQVLVEIEVAGVNFIDVYHRTGLYKTELPVPLGVEGAGVVAAVGSGVTTIAVGERVAWSSGGPGSYATHALVAAERALPVPEGLDLQRAVAVLLQGLTAHYLTTDTFPLRTGHVVLIHAAAGGTGRLLVQLAKRAGARVIGTVSTEEKAAEARLVGADEIILYHSQQVDAEVQRLTGGRGVDVVYDSVGASTFQASLKSLRARGYLVLFGQSSGPVGTIDPQILQAGGSLFLTRPTLAHYTATRAELLGRAQDLFSWLAAGALELKIARTFPLAEARAAHEALEGRETSGKILLVP